MAFPVSCQSEVIPSIKNVRKRAYDAGLKRAYHVANWKRDKQKRNGRTRERLAVAKSGPCADCGKRYHPCAMEFDHLPGTNKIAKVSRIAATSPRSLAEEISKCDLLCVRCHRIRTKARTVRTVFNRKHRQAREDYILALKSKPCSDCSTCFPPEAMEFDHVRGVKVACISVMMRNASFERLIAEVEKTELVCAVCHALRTNSRRSRG